MGGKIAVMRGKGHHTTQHGKCLGGVTLSSPPEEGPPPLWDEPSDVFSIWGISSDRASMLACCAKVNDTLLHIFFFQKFFSFFSFFFKLLNIISSQKN
jgi:hypothetical protein